MSQYRPVPIGVDDYKKLIDADSSYVDKTLLIKEFWQDGAEVILAPRPRRFGKTLNLSMLKYFFEKTKENTSYLFEKMNIWDHPEYQVLQGQFPVIFLTFKDIKVDSWEAAYEEFAIIISEECKRLSSSIAIKKMSASDFAIFNKLIDKQASEQELTRSLQFLSRILHEQTGKNVIVLIDEYDTPIIEAYIYNYYEKMIKFMRNLLSKVLKSNPAVKKAFLTGITRTAKDGIFSGLNNPAIRTILSNKYSDKFGFTQEEVDQLLINYNLADKRNEVKDWYDGYVFGTTNIYNPWSLLSYIDEGKFKPYWANTSDNKLIKNIIATCNQEIKNEIEFLLQSHTLKDKKINENVILPDLKNDNQEPWSFLLFTGYLTAISHSIINENYCYTLTIPNKEIIKLYQELILEILNTTITFDKLKKLFDALMVGDKKIIEQYLQEFLTTTCSSHDMSKNDLERNIHMLVLGLLAGLSDRYLIQSNRESGNGRYDIMLMPKKPQDPGVLIEFKRATSKKALVAFAQKALEQIKALSYKTDIRNRDYQGRIICYGIAVFGKHVMVNMEII